MAAVSRVTWLRWAAVAAAVGGVVALATLAPAALRRVDAFRVRRVEVLGTRYLPPHEALAASGITEASSVFDDPEPWLAGLRAHPMVAEATVERELPGTIVLTIVEVEPVALARTPELRPVDARGRVLPIDPTQVEIDLPVVGVASKVDVDGRLSDSVAVALVEALDRIRRRAPDLAARVSGIDAAEGGAYRVTLLSPTGLEVLLPADFDGLRLEHLRLTLADLGARREMARVRRVDVRFRDQVVVSLTSKAES